MNELKLGRAYKNLSEACEGADALLILNNHEKYINLTRSDTGNLLILDAWQVCKNINNSFTLGNMLLTGDEQKCE